MLISSPGCYLYFWPIAIIRGSQDTFRGPINFLEQLAELRKTFYLLDYWFIIKGTAFYNRTCIDQGMRKGHRASMLFPSMPLFLKPQMFTNPEALQTLSIWGFMEASFHRHDWLTHFSSMTDSTSTVSPLNTPILQSLGWFSWQPAPNLSCNP